MQFVVPFSSIFCVQQSKLREVILFDKTAIMQKLLAIYFIVFLFFTKVSAQIPLGVEKCADFCPAINSSDSGGLQDVREVISGDRSTITTFYRISERWHKIFLRFSSVSVAERLHLHLFKLYRSLKHHSFDPGSQHHVIIRNDYLENFCTQKHLISVMDSCKPLIFIWH